MIISESIFFYTCVVDAVMCYPDPPSGMDLIPPSGNAFVWWLSAVSPYQKLPLGEESCLVQVHVPFPEAVYIQ